MSIYISGICHDKFGSPNLPYSKLWETKKVCPNLKWVKNTLLWNLWFARAQCSLLQNTTRYVCCFFFVIFSFLVSRGKETGVISKMFSPCKTWCQLYAPNCSRCWIEEVQFTATFLYSEGPRDTWPSWSREANSWGSSSDVSSLLLITGIWFFNSFIFLMNIFRFNHHSLWITLHWINLLIQS